MRRCPVRHPGNFYPRPPRGGRLHRQRSSAGFTLFLSSPSARRATQPWHSLPIRRHISIHALREEGDSAARIQECRRSHFYPRPPRGGRHDGVLRPAGSDQFLSTPSARRATLIGQLRQGEEFEFLSTPSARRATPEKLTVKDSYTISIHALREEGDPRKTTPHKLVDNFYPRPPRGGRQQKQRQNLYFQTNYTTFCTNLEEP